MDGGLRDWLAGLTRRETALLSIVGLVVLGGVGWWYVRSLPQPVTVATTPAAAPTAAATPVPLIVHVTGSVASPGVYELPEGARVVDAVEEAGGAKRGAELGALNLAAVLVDGQQIVVPRAGGVPAPGATSSAVPGAPGSTLVNINAATPEELETLPGIGEVLAASIVQHREEHGPFTSVEQLLDVSGIGEVTLEEIRDLVTV